MWNAHNVQGIGVEVDRERALKLYQAALRAEGQLEGGLATAGDDTMAALFEAKQEGLLSDTKKGISHEEAKQTSTVKIKA